MGSWNEKRLAPGQPLQWCGVNLIQTGDVVSDRFDFPVIQLGRDLVHLQTVFAHAVTELGELRHGVVGVLAAQPGVLGWDASAIGAVATGASGDLAVSNAATVDFFTQGGQFFVFGEAGLGPGAAQIGANVAHVVVAQGGGKAQHDGVGTLARFEFGQLLGGVFGVLLGQLRVGGRAGVAIGTVTGHACGVVQGSAFGRVGFGGG